ncbi:hypothetical protein [Nitrosomonas nitrosa]|uniref:hypothetical protein n=1 Tax=Nitrosomonas nitrosa TaxID=52442 RepID=UPI0015E7B91B|nr:hypothetical protein [Nitrosomonas nitrosa]
MRQNGRSRILAFSSAIPAVRVKIPGCESMRLNDGLAAIHSIPPGAGWVRHITGFSRKIAHHRYSLYIA